MINELWSEAAVNADYNGLPFKEVSPAEVTSAMSELRLSPTLLDMLSPVSDSAGADVNIDITINNNSGSDTGNNGNIDLGEDPGVKEP
ncbi:virulence factor PuvA domain protein, partial [Escherichia coli]|nr:virulence factor PuvA domain protein [Escherichia coli]